MSSGWRRCADTKKAPRRVLSCHEHDGRSLQGSSKNLIFSKFILIKSITYRDYFREIWGFSRCPSHDTVQGLHLLLELPQPKPVCDHEQHQTKSSHPCFKLRAGTLRTSRLSDCFLQGSTAALGRLLPVVGHESCPSVLFFSERRLSGKRRPCPVLIPFL